MTLKRYRVTVTQTSSVEVFAESEQDAGMLGMQFFGLVSDGTVVANSPEVIAVEEQDE